MRLCILSCLGRRSLSFLFQRVTHTPGWILPPCLPGRDDGGRASFQRPMALGLALSSHSEDPPKRPWVNEIWGSRRLAGGNRLNQLSAGVSLRLRSSAAHLSCRIQFDTKPPLFASFGEVVYRSVAAQYPLSWR
ncbi:hypothetical protein B0T16DRAFT_86781 [Cercophora newfieldiana]|uniref:Uncharacterized protein n=1 Tax=Cercophora newfieldiana TaxID=92897 RepID=A0AA39YFN4_9PEZI|nr:hypothetical protein B0T16DRAFT_86781 [Cercophora newfieldiana]